MNRREQKLPGHRTRDAFGGDALLCRLVFVLALLPACTAADTDTADSLLNLIDLGSHAGSTASAGRATPVDTPHFELQMPFRTFSLKYAVVETAALRDALLMGHARCHAQRVYELESPKAVYLAILHRMELPTVAVGTAWELRGNIQPVYMDRLVSAQLVRQSRLASDQDRVAVCFALLGPVKLRIAEPVIEYGLVPRRDVSLPCEAPAHPDRGLVMHDRDTYDHVYVFTDRTLSPKELIGRVEATMDRMGLPLSVPTPVFRPVAAPAAADPHEQ